MSTLSQFNQIFSITVANELGIMNLIKLAVGEDGYINPDFNPECFMLAENGAQTTALKLVPFLSSEIISGCWQRLEQIGCRLGNTAQLAAFYQQYPEEVAKYMGVFALSKDSRMIEASKTYVPLACTDDGQRGFGRVPVDKTYSDRYCVLVLFEQSSNA